MKILTNRLIKQPAGEYKADEQKGFRMNRSTIQRTDPRGKDNSRKGEEEMQNDLQLLCRLSKGI